MLGDSKRLSELLRGNVSIVCHHNADPDAVGAAYAVQRLIALLDPHSTAEILYPDTASQLSEKMIARYKIEASKTSKLGRVDTAIAVDVGTLIQVEALREVIDSAPNRVFIDHHGRDTEIEKVTTVYISDERAVATCELVHCLWQQLGYVPPKDVAEVLLIGIVFDSKHLGIGTPRTFRAVAGLLESGASLSVAKDLLQTSMDQSEKIARLKSAQRAKVYRIGPWLVASANLSSFQASAARGMMTLGADVTIVAGNEKKILKASIRASDDFGKQTGIHVGDDLSKPLAELFGGEGGGHPTASGINGAGDADDFLDIAVTFLAERIGKPTQLL